MAINTKLPLNRCWDMVNHIQLADNPVEIRKRCVIAEQWLRANTVISNEDFDDLMRAVSYIYCESYHLHF